MNILCIDNSCVKLKVFFYRIWNQRKLIDKKLVLLHKKIWNVCCKIKVRVILLFGNFFFSISLKC